jgi:hypothetical protein
MWRTVRGAVLILNSAQPIATHLIRVGIGVPLLCRARGALSGDVWILSWDVRGWARAGRACAGVLSVIDSITMPAPSPGINFGGANQPRPGERSRTMIIIGCDYHPGFQQIACFQLRCQMLPCGLGDVQVVDLSGLLHAARSSHWMIGRQSVRTNSVARRSLKAIPPAVPSWDRRFRWAQRHRRREPGSARPRAGRFVPG